MAKEKQGKKKKKKKSSTVPLLIGMLLGLILVLYPSLSNYYNQFHQSRAINDYAETVSKMSKDEYDALWQRAVDFNKDIPTRKNRYLLDEETKKEYNAVLNLQNNGVMGYVEIPSISVSLPIYHGTSSAVLQVAVGHLDWTSVPTGGESTHCVISGHRGLPSATLFTHLDSVKEGELFHLRVLNETLTYQVDQIKVVEPKNTQDLIIEQGEDYCTLVTCTPYGINSHRMLVRGRRVETPEEAVKLFVVADAARIDPMIILPIIAIILLLIFSIVLTINDIRKKRQNRIPKKAASPTT
ncbi:MAG: class C sortase [Clostridia bacterium]|nr:class C sortase [Clostridia bacterium]